MKALKLIWLADPLHLRKYGRPIFGDNYIATPHGPVASSTRNILKGNFDGIVHVINHTSPDTENRYFYRGSGNIDISVFLRQISLV